MNEKFMTKYITLLGLATICCALWGSAPVCIKLGYELFQIQSSETMNILLFAGCRFTLAGFLVVAGYSLIRRKPVLPGKTSGKAI
ncbi:MAG: EamA/RhaT family transporter, partial [Firmicutes bacterium]|nr:EamA/RhaT family transporter [Bacillota bacterium]